MSVPVPGWQPPWTPTGEPSFVRVSTSHLQQRVCPEQVAKKARPEVWPADRGDYIPKQAGVFPLALARDAVVRLLTAGTPSAAEVAIADVVAAAARASGEPWPDPSVSVAEQALAGYVAVLQRLRDTGQLAGSRVFADVVHTDTTGAVPVEVFAWAVHHVSDDGRVRETHLLRWSSAAEVRLTPAAVAAAAHTIAVGDLAETKTLKQWSQPYQARSHQPPHPPHAVRVRVIGLLDGSDDVRFDGDPAAAAAAFARDALPALPVLAGGDYAPGRRCADCALRQQCPGLPQLPGLLGVAGYSEHTRALSPSDLWLHRACPRQLHLRDLGLPRAATDPHPAARRGLQIHQWLATAHDRGIACTAQDLPGPDQAMAGGPVVTGAGIATELGWSYDDYVTNRQYLRHHLHTCPAGAALTGVASEQPVTAWDTDANVVVSTRPDSIYTRPDARAVVRETKTVHLRGLPADEADLLDHFPQVALNVCLLADGAGPPIPSDAQPGVAELELLTTTGSHLLTFDAADPLVVLQARSALAGRVDTWLFDTTHPTGDRPPCQTCPVTEYCDPADRSAGSLTGTELTALVADPEAPWSSVADTDLLAGAGLLTDEDDDIPF